MSYVVLEFGSTVVLKDIFDSDNLLSCKVADLLRVVSEGTRYE